MKIDFTTPTASPKPKPLFGASAPAQPEAPKPIFSPEPVESVTITPEKPPQVQETGLSTAQQAALATLSGPAQAAFAAVWELAPSLPTLLDKGVLNDEVAEGLQELAEKQPELTAQVVSTLVDPDHEVFQGINTYTCGAANIQRQLVDDAPTFLQLVDDVSQHPAPGSEAPDSSGRNTLNRLVQGALMKAANPDYDLAKDDSPTGPGLKTYEMAAVTAHFQDQDQAVVVHDSGTHQEFVSIFNRGDNFQIGVSWNDHDHMLLYQGQENGVATYFNPQEATSGTMPVDKLLYKTQFAIFPEHQMEGAQLPEDAVRWARINEEAPQS